MDPFAGNSHITSAVYRTGMALVVAVLLRADAVADYVTVSLIDFLPQTREDELLTVNSEHRKAWVPASNKYGHR